MTTDRFPTLFSPIRVGKMELPNRLMMAPHTGYIGADMGSYAPFGSAEAAERNLAYLRARARAGVPWLTTITGLIANLFPPGFEPTGLGAMTSSSFHMPIFEERVGRIVAALHQEGAYMGVQLVMQAGTPHAPSPVQSSFVSNVAPHVLSAGEIAWLIAEFTFSASRASDAGVDVIELHVNHDDIMEQFLSPLTNRRTDDYGGDPSRRLHFVERVLQGVRSVVRPGVTVGMRFTMNENVVGGYGLEAAAEIARQLGSGGLIEYIHVVMGSPWGNPSYIQPAIYGPAPWAAAAARIRQAAGVPLIYSGRVESPDVAEDILASGFADVVGMARGLLADPDVLTKARSGNAAEIRPCIGCNDCIHRPLVDGLAFACSVNPSAGREADLPLPRIGGARRLLVVGGGPAGMELAALSAERGLDVVLWERDGALGGQIRIAARAPGHGAFAKYIAFQARRLAAAGVTIALGKDVAAADLAQADADIVAIATGASSRVPDIEGVGSPNVIDIRTVLSGANVPGKRVAVVVQDDYLAPLAVAHHLATSGHHVTMVYQSPAIAPMVGKYSLGGFLGQLCAHDVQFILMEQVVAVYDDRLKVRNVYTQQERFVGSFDAIVLACGGVSESSLYDELKAGQVPNLHILGDAFAPRRISFATQQAYALAVQF